MTEQELKDEREQAVKRGGEIYADHYMEGLIDGRNLALSQTPVSGSVFYEVHFTDCFPRTFEVKKGQNINELVKAHIKVQNSGVPKSERIYLERIVRL